MKEKQVTKVVYETVDGQQFDIEEEAKEHEKNLFIDIFSLEGIALMIKESCIERGKCMCCPFYDSRGFCGLVTTTPEKWKF